ncbi:MAG: NAD(P)-dependent oxidoreductase [Deltaproteobacteria bacterium]|nr:NAD(P)-dependent oxidoreductase [Deltaproteobacteria bacterium]
MDTIGIIGLGRMGISAARRFVKAGVEVIGYDTRPEAIEVLKSEGGQAAANSKQVAQKAKAVIIFVLNDQQVIEVITGKNGVLQGVGQNSIVICMSTIDRDNVESMAENCTQNGVGFVDCPCTGGPARVENGTLTMIAAAPPELLERCRSKLEVMGNIIYAGETPGLGQAIKHCNQLLIGATHAAVMEIIALARKSDLDPRLVCEVIGNGIGGSDYFRLLSDSVLNGTSSPGGMGQLIKDINLVINDSKRVQLPLLVATAAFQYFLAAQSLGLENEDSSQLIKVIEKMAGLEPIHLK